MVQEQLNGLALLHFHYSMDVNAEDILNMFARKHSRRMTLINVLCTVQKWKSKWQHGHFHEYITVLPTVHPSLSLGRTPLQSSEGVQQGDTLGPLLFCLAIHPLTEELTSELVGSHHQKNWDLPKVFEIAGSILEKAHNVQSWARLLAASKK